MFQKLIDQTDEAGAGPMADRIMHWPFQCTNKHRLSAGLQRQGSRRLGRLWTQVLNVQEPLDCANRSRLLQTGVGCDKQE